MLKAGNLTLKEILLTMKDPELAYASMEFWKVFEAEFDAVNEITDETWNMLLAFQIGWLRCKQFYKQE